MLNLGTYRASTAYATALQGSKADTAVQSTLGVRLDTLGFTPATDDVRDLVAAAAAASSSGTVIIPYHEDPWVSEGLWVIDGITVIWERNAKVAQNHIATGIQMLNGAKLIAPYLTSTVYTAETMAGIGAGGPTDYAHGARRILVDTDDAEILDIQMLEYMAAGIYCEGKKNLKVTNLTARHLRSYEGYAAAIDPKNVDGGYCTINHIHDCDRACEPEDGTRNFRFIAAPGIIERIVSGYYHNVGNPTSDSFCLSVHAHSGENPCVNVSYEGRWTVVDSAQPVYFTKSTGNADNLPQNCSVEYVNIINTAAFPTAQTPRDQVWIDGHNCSVAVQFSPRGASVETTLRAVVQEGRCNRVKLVGPDIQAAIPWARSETGAEGTVIEVEATKLTVQPTAGANAGVEHLIEARGPGTEIRNPKFHGVQNRGYIKLVSSGPGSRVTNADIVAPASAGPNAAIRMQATRCSVIGGQYSDPSNVMQFARFIDSGDKNLITGVVTRKSTGTFATLDTGADNNAIVNNVLDGSTITDTGSGNTKTNF